MLNCFSFLIKLWETLHTLEVYVLGGESLSYLAEGEKDMRSNINLNLDKYSYFDVGVYRCYSTKKP